MQNIKVVFVGDDHSGKSYLLNKCAGVPLLEDTGFSNQSVTRTFQGQPILLGLWDTKGGADYDRLRPLSYPCTDIFYVCFSLIETHDTLDRISQKWIPEIRHHMPGTPIILVGTKKDMRDDPQVLEQLQEKPISYEEGKRKAKDVDVIGYVECSAITGEGVDELLEMGIQAVLLPPNQRRKKGRCTIL